MNLKLLKLIYKPLNQLAQESMEELYEQARYNTFTSNNRNNYKDVFFTFVLGLILVTIFLVINFFAFALSLEEFASPVTMGINILIFYYVFLFLRQLILISLMDEEILKLIEAIKHDS